MEYHLSYRLQRAQMEQMDILARDTGIRHESLSHPVLLAQGCIAVDSDGTPHIFHVSHRHQPDELIQNKVFFVI